MPTGWQTFPVEFKGGLLTNVSPLQQGLQAPGSARVLRNFEPSIEGGYRRIQGYTKYDNTPVPTRATALVQGSGQGADTTLNVANLYSTPVVGDVITVSGVTGTYTVTAPIVYSAVTKNATLTLSTSLATSPADKATVTFANNTSVVNGLVYYNTRTIAYRNGELHASDGTGWTKINVPSLGTVLVNGAGQTGTTLNVDGLTGTPMVGDSFSVAGVEQVYVVASAVTVTSGAAAITITPALASSPADNAAVTFLTADRSGTNKLRYTRFDYTGAPSVALVDGSNRPAVYSGTTFYTLTTAPTEIIGANHVAEFKNHLFFAKGNDVVFTAPYTFDDFTPASGAGSIRMSHAVTGMIVFREQLIVFCRSKIYRITGNSIADFVVQPIALDIGCIHEDTIQEVGGDVMFVATDGIRMLSATDRIGDFGLAVASRGIQKEVLDFVSANTSFASCVVRGKNQYRLFGYATSIKDASAQGILGTQFADQTAEGMAWAELRGIRANVVDSIYTGQLGREIVVFAHSDGYVYRMESGNSFDGDDITSVFSTPYFSVADPRIRKTCYKLHTYIDPVASVVGTASLKYDFDQPGTIQPVAVDISNTTSPAAFYGSAVFGVATYGGRLVTMFTNQVVGSGFTVSVQYTFTDTNPPFTMDALVLELATNDRQ